MLRVNATQWPTYKIANSCNNYLDTVTGYAIGADNRFDWDDTNHSKLPIGTTPLVANQQDYSFLTDEQGNSIITLTRLELLQASGLYVELNLIHKDEIGIALDEYQKVAGIPNEYLKMSDNIVRLKPKPLANLDAGLKFYFQRTGSYFTASDTTKAPGVSPLLHRGFIINAVYDAAMALGLPILQAFGTEKAYEEKKMIQYFSDRNEDEGNLVISGEEICSA